MRSQDPHVFPLTYEQEAIWLHEHLDDSPSVYLESWACRLRGAVDASAVEWAVAQIVSRHPALRSSFDDDGSGLVQIVRDDHVAAMERVRCSGRELDGELAKIVRRPLDLRTSPYRATLLEVAPDDVVLVIQLHHLVADDWAVSILEQEFQEFYCARAAGRPAQLAPLRLQPGEYATAQRAAGVDPAAARYWRERLRDAPIESTVPADRQRPQMPTYAGGVVRFRINSDLRSRIRLLARRSRTTPFSLMAAGVGVLLSAYNGSSDQILGTAVSRRGQAGSGQMITCMTDLLPVRLDVRGEDSFAALVHRTKQAVAQVVEHRNLPFSLLLKELRWPREFNRPPLCQTAIVVDDAQRCSFEFPGIHAERLYVHSGMSKFDLSFALVADDGYLGFLEYARDLFRPQTAGRISENFGTLLAAAVADPDRSLAELVGCICAGSV
jgi:hypothetical protein